MTNGSRLLFAAATVVLNQLASTAAAQKPIISTGFKRHVQDTEALSKMTNEDMLFWDRYLEQVVASSFISASTSPPTSLQRPTSRPSKSPVTNSPTKIPTSESASQLSTTSAPTSSPTSTAPTTKIPTKIPSKPPTAPPSQGPTNSPSAVPTGTCIVETTLTCANSDGEDCNRIKPPSSSLSCTENGPPRVLRFLITKFRRCQDSINSQNSDCTDYVSVAPSMNQVDIACMSPTDNKWDFFVQGMTKGSAVSLLANRGRVLPTQVQCMIFTSGNLQPDQVIDIDLSGHDDAPLYLQDTFGSLQLEACDQEDCMMDITYEYSVTNTGMTNATIMTLEREREEQLTNMLPSLTAIVVESGESTTAIEVDRVNYCVDNLQLTTLSVEAVPSNGGPVCPATASYEFETNVACRMDIEIECRNEFGVPCDEIISPEGTCGVNKNEPISILRFVYQPGTCDDSARTHQQPEATCRDDSPIPSNQEVSVTCHAGNRDGMELVVAPKIVAPGKPVEISNPAGLLDDGINSLPDLILCSIGDSAGDSATIYQEFTFYTSNGHDIPLKVKNQFGSLELEACTDMSDAAVDCLQAVNYTYTINNVGVNDMSLAGVERNRNNQTNSLVPLLEVTNLKPGESTIVWESDTIDVCKPNSYETRVSVEGNPENRLRCYGEDTFSFDINPPCEIMVQLSCRTVDDNLDCAPNLAGEELVECRCEDSCPTELIYRYTGGGCGGTMATECTDVQENSSEDASIVMQHEGTIYFQGTVSVGNDIVISAAQGECLPNHLEAVVSNSNKEITQEVIIEASCAIDKSTVTLQETFGAFEFAGYTCPDGISHNCYVEVEYAVTVTNTGTVGQAISDWFFSLNALFVTDRLPVPSIGPQEEITQTARQEIELCSDTQYEANALVESIGKADGQTCADSEKYIFSVVTGTPFPTQTQCALPTNEPSVSPTIGPSDGPTEAPSCVPSSTPTQFPSDIPSNGPTGNPTTFPTGSPSDSPSTVPTANPTNDPTGGPTISPSDTPSRFPTFLPSDTPSHTPTFVPSWSPTRDPSVIPTISPSTAPTGSSFSNPTYIPSDAPSDTPTSLPSRFPTANPSIIPTAPPSTAPSDFPSLSPTTLPSDIPSDTPTNIPTVSPMAPPSAVPTAIPSDQPSNTPSWTLTAEPTIRPSDIPSTIPTSAPTATPTLLPSDIPSDMPSLAPTLSSSDFPTPLPTLPPTGRPTPLPTPSISDLSSDIPSFLPSVGRCELDIGVTCIPLDGSESCNATANQTFTVDVGLPLETEGGPAILSIYTVATDFEFNFTDRVEGISLMPGKTVSVTIEAPIDLMSRQTYNLLITVFALTDTGKACRETVQASFDTGYTLPYELPTALPTTVDVGSLPGGSAPIVPNPTPVPDSASDSTSDESPTQAPVASSDDSPSDDSPTLAPTPVSSSFQSIVATNAVLDLESASPTATPQTVMPTSGEPCEFDLEITCVPPAGVKTCNATPPPVTQCTGRPFEMVFLYNGGDCSQSFNVQADKFFCSDLNGGPPTELGAKSYIVVTDLDGETIYHSDWVEVGSTFVLADGGNRFEANQLITIYNNSDTTDPANILQSIQYHSSCSSNLFLKDRFGATQLVVWVNEDQGVITCFANQTFNLDITVPLDITGGPATFTGLTVASNVDPYFFNLTDKIAGVQAEAGVTVSVSVSMPIDLTVKKKYNLLVTLLAITDSGINCSATELTSFEAGMPLPPIFPTFAPTISPTDDALTPTPDPETSICNLKADISCRSSYGWSCRSLQPPTSTVCSSSSTATSISFVYTGRSCNETANCMESNPDADIMVDPVYVVIEGDDGVGFSQAVDRNGLFTITDGLDGRITMTVYSLDTNTNGPGDQLQQITGIRTTCNGQAERDLVLLQDYGAFQVVGFTNEDQGTQTALEELTLTYTVVNDGPLEATVTSVATPAQGEWLADGEVILAGFESISFSETTIVNLIQDNSRFQYDLLVKGVATQSGDACLDTDTYSFFI